MESPGDQSSVERRSQPEGKADYLRAPGEAPETAQLRALIDGALLATLPGIDHLRLTGADRVDFLHGQVSNDVRGLPVGGSNSSLLLNHRGHALAQMRVLRSSEAIDVLVQGGAGDLVERSLKQHIIFDQVELSRPEQPQVALSLQGALANEVLKRAKMGSLPEEGQFQEAELAGAMAVVVPSRRSAQGGYDILLDEAHSHRVSQALADSGATVGEYRALELARIVAGVATAAGEAGEGILPQEAGLEGLVSYRKGCYLGQEIMARIESRGKLRRRLSALRLEQEPKPGEFEVRSQGKLVGRLGSVALHPAVGLLALAVLRNDLAPGEPLEVAGTFAKLLELPIEEPLGLGGAGG